MKKKARARKPGDPYDSKLERDYAQRLEEQRLAGEIVSWQHHPIRVILAKASNYTPDFLVVNLDGEIELHEVKGWHPNMASSRKAWKSAAEKLPQFWFVWVTRRRVKDPWTIERYE